MKDTMSYVHPTLQEYLDDQAECLAVIEREWLFWPLSNLDRIETEETETRVRQILGHADAEALDKVILRDGALTLLWCCAPNGHQREELAKLPGVSSLLAHYN